jgi:4-methylaminobutanoate oxidase (formaldehyde-forming)
MNDLPSSAKIVIIGGGIVGCSVAYHLGKMGVTDVILLERGKLTCGSTWHAAGLVGQLRTSANITQLLGYSVALYDKLEKETGLATGWKRNGGLRLACNAERWTEVKRQATTATSFGLEMHLLTPKEAQDLWPLMQVDDVVGAAFLPTDGQASPSDITMSLAKGARMAGVGIVEDVTVTGIDVESGRVCAVVTDRGRIACDKLVICAGQWSRGLGRMAGVNVPLVSVQHQYLITEPIGGVTRTLPTLRDPDRLTYWKEEVGGLVMGGYEPNPKPWATEGFPENFEFQLLENDLDHFEPLLELAIGRVPAMETAGIKEFFNGPESFTPDGNFILGEAPEVRGVFVGAGFNAFGIASGGGAGMVLAEWTVKREPPYDLSSVDIRRFGRNHLDTNWVRTRTLEAYAKHYTMAWPFEEYRSGRPLRRSPLYDKLKAQGASFGEKLGWERPNWFADLAGGEEAEDVYSYKRQNWFDAVGREHQADRAVPDGELGDGRVEALGGEIEQHAPRLGRHAAHRPAVALDPVGAARAALVGRRVGAAHYEAGVVVGDVELVAHELPEGRAGALTTVGLADEKGRGIIRVDHDPGVELEKIGVRIGTCARGLREHLAGRTGPDAATDDQRARGFEEIPPRRGWIRAPQCGVDGFGQIQLVAHALASWSLARASASAVAPRTARLIAACIR